MVSSSKRTSQYDPCNWPRPWELYSGSQIWPTVLCQRSHCKFPQISLIDQENLIFRFERFDRAAVKKTGRYAFKIHYTRNSACDVNTCRQYIEFGYWILLFVFRNLLDLTDLKGFFGEGLIVVESANLFQSFSRFIFLLFLHSSSMKSNLLASYRNFSSSFHTVSPFAWKRCILTFFRQKEARTHGVLKRTC